MGSDVGAAPRFDRVTATSPFSRLAVHGGTSDGTGPVSGTSDAGVSPEGRRTIEPAVAVPAGSSSPALNWKPLSPSCSASSAAASSAATAFALARTARSFWTSSLLLNRTYV